MSSNRLLFNDVEVVSLENGRHIPTALYYTYDGFLSGVAAENAAESVHDLNLGFKMDLGTLVPTRENRMRKKTNASDAGVYKDAQELTRDFLGSVVNEAIEKMPSSRDKTTVLMAEPIAMEGDLVQSGWLRNYRKYIREVMSDHGFDDVQFLPEPFAVYQYYRYGRRHQALSDDQTYDALVIDFGAGTLDTCVINTTKKGDISRGGRNSRPLGAAAERVGGYYINEELAIQTYLRYYSNNDESKRKRFIDYLKTYRARRKGKIPRVDDEEKKRFCDNLEDLVYSIETAKIGLSSQISNWDPEAELDDRAPLKILTEPWKEDSKKAQTWITASDLKNTFINKVWNKHVKGTIEATIERSRDALEGRKIDLVLLSGGTCNLKWLPNLIERDLREEIDYAKILTLPEYREVVAKGLAIECARQFYTESHEGDFAETMYNKLNLLLDAEDYGKFDVKKFNSQSDGLPDVSDSPGTLLPSATELSDLIGKKLQWKVKLSSRPTNRLDYRFLKSSLDYEDSTKWLNVQEHYIDTPQEFKQGGWDSSTTVQIKIEKGGTVYPTFIYQKENNYADGKKVEGQPFMLEMMTDLEAGGREDQSYLGIDFGTSNSSISYIDHHTIEVFNRRSSNNKYTSIQEMKSELPFILARPLAEYLSAPDTKSKNNRARRLFEVAFNFIVSICYIEAFASEGRSKISNIKRHHQVTIGQTWGTVKEVLPKRPDDSFLKPLNSILEGPAFQEIDSVVTKLAREKHGKENTIKSLRALTFLFNELAHVLDDLKFGFFQSMDKVGGRRRKKYTGRFRVAHGHGRPFTESLVYEGREGFSDEEALLVNPNSGRALALFPFVIWKRCKNHNTLDSGHCYLFDKYYRDREEGTHYVEFLSIADGCTRLAPSSGDDVILTDAAEWMKDLRHGEGKNDFQFFDNITLDGD